MNSTHTFSTHFRTMRSFILLALLSFAGGWTTVSAQTVLTPGDIAFVELRGDTPDYFSWFFLVDVAAGTNVRFTDSGWRADNGTTGETERGVVVWTAPPAGVTAGTVITINLPTSTTVNTTLGSAVRQLMPPLGGFVTSGGVAISTSGDQITAFQTPGNANIRPTSGFIASLAANSTNWNIAIQSNGTLNPRSSNIFPGLTDNLNCASVGAGPDIDDEWDNVRLNPMICGSLNNKTKDQILAIVYNDANWQGSNSGSGLTPFSAAAGCNSFSVISANTPPTVTCPNVEFNAGVTVVIFRTGGAANDVSFTITDESNTIVASGNATVTLGPNSFLYNLPCDANYTFNYTDNSGGTTANVQLQVNNSPVLSLNPIVTGNYPFTLNPCDVANPGTCSTVLTGLAPTVSDITATTTYTLSGATTNSGNIDASGQSFNVGTTTLTYTATNAGGSSGSCSVDITINDNTDPIANCPSTQTVNNDPGQCGAVVNFTIPFPSDNCSGVTSAADIASGSFFDVGTTEVTLTATDGSGNTNTCSFDVVVNDTEQPTASNPAAVMVSCPEAVPAPDPAVVTNEMDNCSATVAFVGDTDNGGSGCMGSPLIITREYSVTDPSSNSISVFQTITVEDNTPPTASNPAPVNVSCFGDIPASDPTVVMDEMDNCNANIVVEYVGDVSNGGLGSIASPYIITRTYRVTDCNGNGNSIDVEQTITVSDSENPTASNPAPVNVNCFGDIPAADPTVVTDEMDNCNGNIVVAFVEDVSNGGFGTVASPYIITRTYSVTDGAGNSINVEQTITVSDSEQPMVNCPGNVTQQVDAGETFATVNNIALTTSDNCTMNPTVTYGIAAATTVPAGTPGDASGTEFNLGISLVQYISTDAAGNANDCSFTVTVEAAPEPEIGVMANASALVDGVSTSDFGNVNVDGGTATTTFTISNTGTADLILDANPVSVTGSSAFTVTQPALLTVPPNGNTSFTITFNPANNQCGTQMAAISIGSNDADEDPFNFSVGGEAIDNAGPAIDCPDDVTIDCDADSSPAGIAGMATATDNCDESPTITFSDVVAAGACAQESSIFRAWDATDASGNKSSCLQTITITDGTAPVITCPADVTIECDASSDPANTGNATATDNCDGSPVITFVDVTAPGACAQESTITRTWTATDACGNSSSCEQIITITDGTAPVITCPADVTIECDASSDPDNTGNATATDNCDGSPTITFSDIVAPGSGQTLSTITRTWTATDACGNSSSCDQIITVTDTEAPSITCPPNSTVSTDGTDCDYDGSPGQITNFDNCTGITLKEDYFDESGNNFLSLSFSTNNGTGDIGENRNLPVGTNTVTLTLTDAAGLTDVCSFTVTVQDSEDPVPSCPGNITVDNDPGVCNAIVTFSTGATDNCPGATASASPASGSTFNVGTTPVTVTATDAAGNTSTCTFNVTVNDNESPVMVCNSFNLTLTGTSTSITAGQVDGGSTDNCGIIALSASPGAFNCSTLGAQTVTLTGTDAAGNSSSCTGTITVIDGNSPTPVCANPTVNLTSDGTTTVTASFFDGGSSAVCGSVSFSASQTNFDCDDVGNTIPVTLTVTAQSNNQTATCTANVTVADPQSFCCAPANAVCNNTTVMLDASGAASITSADIGGGSTTACGFLSDALSQSTFDCADINSPVSVTYTITDINNVSSSCMATVTVEDNINPTAFCLNPTVELGPDGTYALAESDIFDAVNSTDNCSIANVSFPPTGFTCDDTGLTFPITVTVEDPSGKTDACVAMVSVETGTDLPLGWTANDIGNAGAGSSYAYDPCARNNPNQGDFDISTGAFNLIPNTSDNVAFVGRELCNNGGIQARIEDVNGGYAGLMIRESSAPGAKMFAVYSNLTNLLRREIRTIDNGTRTSTSAYASFPYWLRLVRQGNYIRAFYRNTNNGNWTFFHQAYLPMQECVEMGLAVFTTDPNGQANATFSRVSWLSNAGGSNLAAPNEGPTAAPLTQREISVFPNPTRSAFTLWFSEALQNEATATLRNQMGQVIAQRQLQPGEINTEWDVNGLPGGLYLIEVQQEGQLPQVLRLIKTE